MTENTLFDALYSSISETTVTAPIALKASSSPPTRSKEITPNKVSSQPPKPYNPVLYTNQNTRLSHPHSSCSVPSRQ